MQKYNCALIRRKNQRERKNIITLSCTKFFEWYINQTHARTFLSAHLKQTMNKNKNKISKKKNGNRRILIVYRNWKKIFVFVFFSILLARLLVCFFFSLNTLHKIYQYLVSSTHTKQYKAYVVVFILFSFWCCKNKEEKICWIEKYMQKNKQLDDFCRNIFCVRLFDYY